MSDAKTNSAENKVLTWLLTPDSVARPSGRYVGLHTGDPGEDADQSELSGDGYARIVATFAVTGSTAENDAAITFGPATAPWGTVSHFSVWDAVTGGNPIYKGALTTPRAVGTSDRIAFDVGALEISED
jgi:hypothetical protein